MAPSKDDIARNKEHKKLIDLLVEDTNKIAKLIQKKREWIGGVEGNNISNLLEDLDSYLNSLGDIG